MEFHTEAADDPDGWDRDATCHAGSSCTWCALIFTSTDTRSESDSRPHWWSILLRLSSLCFDWQSVAISRHATLERSCHTGDEERFGELENADLTFSAFGGFYVSGQTPWEKTVHSHTFTLFTKWESRPDFSHPREPTQGPRFSSFSTVLFSLMKRSASGQAGALIPEELIVFLCFSSSLSLSP